ncbi:MAG: Sec-independent protein translocase protein TatB [Gammaproteobacteria bacterium]
MFDVGFTELVLIFVIGLVVLGPERLPKVARTVGRWLGRARQMARSMQYELERELDLKDLDLNATSTKDESSGVTPHPAYGKLPARDEHASDADSDDDEHDQFDESLDHSDHGGEPDDDLAARAEGSRG